MEPQPPSNLPSNSPDLTFQVMPQDLTHPEKSISSAPMPPPPGKVPLPPKPPLHDPMPHLDTAPSGSRRGMMIIIGVIVLVALIGLGLYYFLGKKSTEPTKPQIVTRLPKVWLQQYFPQNLATDGSCKDADICSDDKDPDNDGLSNYDEFITGTSPIDSDTDKDGLADGDEVHVYKTEPTLKYTDRRDVVSQNDWRDAIQIKNGYDPLTPGKKFTDSRLQQIAADKITYPLHEPTITSLGTATIPSNPSPTSPNVKSVTVTIEAGKFNPASITINVGDSVVWLNKDSSPHHVASDPHPTHTGLPGLESPDMAGNQTYSFTFTKAGTFGYHDHLNPTIKGTVIVK